jgi:cyclopropane fatty-acyl-phospholipid synthase-like methyltransferase
MDIDNIKSNLRKYYDQDAVHRNAGKKQIWKIECRKSFCDMAIRENKKTLIELGAGTGHDSKFFVDNGFGVMAVDLSYEMVKLCREKGINAIEMDFYDISSIGQKFDCVWSMNSLLHVPKQDLHMVLHNINNVLNNGGLFFMGVYGGSDFENNFLNEPDQTPRFFSRFSKEKLTEALQRVFDIVQFEQIDIGIPGSGWEFQSIIMRKR